MGLGDSGVSHNTQFAGYRATGRLSAPRGETSFFLLDIQNYSWRASGQKGPRGIGSGCEAHSARTRHNTTCVKPGYKTSARRLPLESLARGCSGSRFFCVPGHAVQGRSSRAPSPARPSFDPDHALPFVLSFHFEFTKCHWKMMVDSCTRACTRAFPKQCKLHDQLPRA